MAKTIAIIASLDSKEQEVRFVIEQIRRCGHQTLVIDVGVRSEPDLVPDIRREEVIRAAGAPLEVLRDGEKHLRLDAMARGAAVLAEKLYAAGRLDAVFSLGGVQNTMIGTSAMKALPYGVPKLAVSTVASGNRTFDPIVGTKDIVLLPSIADISGLNSLTRMVLANGVAAIAGMVEHAGAPLRTGSDLVVGATMMGATGDGVTGAVKLLEQAGLEVISFHSTGVGGRVMEDLIAQGFIGGVLDLTIHEITSEYFGGGYSFGATNRLRAAARAGIPQVVAPGGIDFVDFGRNELPDDIGTRKYIYHNSGIAHIKVHRHEIVAIAAVVAERLNASRGPVTLVIPTRGFRRAAAPGGPLWDPETDQAFVKVLTERLHSKIRVREVDANLDDPEFSQAAAEAFLELIGR